MTKCERREIVAPRYEYLLSLSEHEARAVAAAMYLVWRGNTNCSSRARRIEDALSIAGITYPRDAVADLPGVKLSLPEAERTLARSRRHAGIGGLRVLQKEAANG